MKLVRLLATSETATGIFEWQLSEPIRLEPKSQVALQQASLSVLDSNIEVTASNNQFQFKTAANAAYRTVTIPTGDYTSTTLLRAVEQAMNLQLAITIPSNIGFQWKVVETTGRVDIEYDRVDTDVAAFPNFAVTGGTLAATSLTKTAAGPLWDCWAACAKPFIRSCGYFTTRFTAGTFPAMGLSADGLSGDPTLFRFGVYVDPTTVTYWSVVDGLALDSTIVPTGNDGLGVEISNGVIRCFYRRVATGANSYIGAAANYNYQESFVPVVALAGIAGSTTTVTEFYTDPFSTALDASRKPSTTVILNYTGSYSPASTLLGYQPSEYRIDSQSASHFLAPYPLTSTAAYLSLLVLLESLPTLQSYDSAYGGRRPIIAAISAWQDKSNNIERVDYTPSEPLFLDIGNDTPLFMSNFKIRVLDSEDNPIRLSDGVSFVLIFK